VTTSLQYGQEEAHKHRNTVRNQEAGQPGKLATDFLQLHVLHKISKEIVLAESLRLGQLSKNILEMNVVFK
jgi:hypothetical protein